MRSTLAIRTARAKPRRRRQLLPKASAGDWGTGSHCAGPFLFGIERGGIMGRKLIGRSSSRLLIPLAMIALTGLGVSVASAQTSSQNTRSATATSGSGQYYFEFRSRQSWDYGHTFVVFGRVGEPPSKKNVAGL